ncbi:uncharacterized protein LOC143920878 [Arctopsyche grandis]|uniref:uncharacterized protein LOC143920878 n=1 Tax=Arctopsyche grandis TaxID=121162 RepID=UPI00406D6FFC
MSEQLDVGSLRVAELRKELRARGLSANGDKAELAGRLRAALSIDELDLTALDDEVDADADADVAPGVTSPTAASPPEPPLSPPSPPPVAKKIVLNRSTITPPSSAAPASATAPTPAPAPTPSSTPAISVATPDAAPIAPADARPTKLVADSKSRLEMRAKRFGITSPITSDAKEARKARFGTAATPAPILDAASTATLDILKKRAERFGSSVSKIMVDVENREKLERRKAKFGTVK